jgi:TonB family protein
VLRLKSNWVGNTIHFLRLGCFLVPACLAAQSSSLDSLTLIGNWSNEDSEAVGVTTVAIRRENDRTLVHAWARCYPADCDWGEVESKLRDEIATATWNLTSATETMQLVLQADGRLLVNYRSEFHGNAGRADEQHAEFFRRRTPETEGPPTTTDGRVAQTNGSQKDTEVYTAGGDVSPPYLIRKVEAKYSLEARKAQLSGTVFLSLIIDSQGAPRSVQVIRPLGLGLDEKAVEAVSKWRFHPGMKAGKPVATRAQVQVTFRLGLLADTRACCAIRCECPGDSGSCYRARAFCSQAE